MGNGHQSELHSDFLQSFHCEPGKPVVAFHLTENGFHFYGSLASMVHSLFRYQPFPGFILELIESMVHFNEPIAFSFMTPTAHRAAFASLSLITADLGCVSVGTNSGCMTDKAELLSCRTYIIVILLVVIQILYRERILFMVALLFHMRVIVLDKGSYALFFHQFIVLLATITGVCYKLFALFSVMALKAFQMFRQGCGVGSCLMDAVMGDELIFGADLGIIGWLKLAILHVVLFHPHKHSIGIGLAITIAISQYFQLLFIFL